jgi:hypothetical protein
MAARGREKRDFSLTVQDLQSLLDVKNPKHFPVQFQNDRIGNDPAIRIAGKIGRGFKRLSGHP